MYEIDILRPITMATVQQWMVLFAQRFPPFAPLAADAYTFLSYVVDARCHLFCAGGLLSLILLLFRRIQSAVRHIKDRAHTVYE